MKVATVQLELSPAAFEHLGEIMRGETAGVDPALCVYCAEINRAIDAAKVTEREAP